jgi:hypothetical protein
MTLAVESIELAHRLITQARFDWIENNGPWEDIMDIVTPYDEWFYKDRTVPSCDKTVPTVPAA